MNEQDVERVDIATLSDDQRELLQMYLRGAEIPHELTPTTVTVSEDRAKDLYSALSIVVRARAGLSNDVDQGHGADKHVDDDEHEDDDDDDDCGHDDDDAADGYGGRPPLIKRPPTIADGRAIASRSRRVTGAIIDWLTLDLWALVARSAGAPRWAIVATLGVYVVAATAVFGRTIGKWASGTVVVANRTGAVPGWLRSTLRWLIVSWFSVVSLVLSDLPGGVEVAAFVVLVLTYLPVLWDRLGRGWHDRVADTMVVVARR